MLYMVVVCKVGETLIVASFIIISLGLVVCVTRCFSVMLLLLHSELFAKLQNIGFLHVVELAESLYRSIIFYGNMAECIAILNSVIFSTLGSNSQNNWAI